MRCDPSPRPVSTRHLFLSDPAAPRYFTQWRAAGARGWAVVRVNVLCSVALLSHHHAMPTPPILPANRLEEHPLGDLYDYARPVGPVRKPKAARRNRAKAKQICRPRITDDWPQRVPVTALELDIFEVHFRDFLDELFDQRP